jgi:hypothetical protein
MSRFGIVKDFQHSLFNKKPFESKNSLLQASLKVTKWNYR